MFYSAFSNQIKCVIQEDSANRKRLLELLRFPSSKTSGSNDAISLKEYCERMQEDQSSIFLISGENMKVVSSSPFMERFRQRDLEVLYFTEPIDEYIAETLALEKYNGKKFENIMREGVELGEESLEQLKKEHEGLCAVIKAVIGDDRLASVKVSQQLVGSPAAIVSPKFGMTANMERIVKAQALQAPEHRFLLEGSALRKNMVINPAHEIIVSLKGMVPAFADNSGELDAATSNEVVRRVVQLLFDTAQMSSGFSPDDPAAVAARIHTVLSKSLVSKL